MAHSRYPEHGEKTCSVCEHTKEFSAFYRQQGWPDGRMNVCIVCFKVKNPTKVCYSCHLELPIDDFATHPSSADGHRHTCISCLAKQKVQEQKSQAERRVTERMRRQEEAIQKQEQNRILKAYGYWWKKEEDWNEWGEFEKFVLYTPEREAIEVQTALQQIAQLQVPHYGHPSALWARDICALPNAVILDTETTGLGLQDEIVDLALISVGGKKLLDTLMQCQMATIPVGATKVHHITKAMLDREKAPTFPQIWKRLMERLETYVILIYNADFDRRMLEQTAKRYNLTLPELEIHCLMKPVSAYIGGTKKMYKLEAASHYFHVEHTDAHRAFADVQASQGVLQALARMAVAPETNALVDPQPTAPLII